MANDREINALLDAHISTLQALSALLSALSALSPAVPANNTNRYTAALEDFEKQIEQSVEHLRKIL